MGSLSPWHLLILVAVLVLLFGAKKLPDAARSVGRSLKILKAETKGLRDEDGEAGEQDGPATQAEAKRLPPAQNGAASDNTKVDDLQRQLDELKQQKNAG